MLADIELEAVIATDNGIDYWRGGALTINLGTPIFVVNHPVSEFAVVEALAEHPRAAFLKIPVHHIPQKCMYVNV